MSLTRLLKLKNIDTDKFNNTIRNADICNENEIVSMIKSTLVIVTVNLILMTTPLISLAESIPARVGQCANTKVVKVGTRLDDVAGSGTNIIFQLASL